MKSSTLLHSAVFHLTPTRTRCDLIITAHGKQEKIASGLLNPFVAHLRTAQEQIAKGGYSIILEPQGNRDTSWFTKGTLERFVRFVSTPEILERVHSIESEILQIEKAILVQGRNDLDYTVANDSPGKPLGSQHGTAGIKLAPDEANEEKAIILYKPDAQQAESDQKVPPEGNSRVQLLKVHETRKNVLQKEQGMAFARAVAAGFDFDHMAQLLLFAECFGAERLMGACKSFMDLWKKKHENGQWFEIDTPEPVLNQSEYLAMSASGIMLSSVANKHQSIDDVGSDKNEGERAQKDNCGQPEQFQGQFPHPMYAPWPMQSPGSVPVFPPYPMQGMPYYPTYPGIGPYYHPPYPANGDSHYDGGHKTGKRRQSTDDKDSDSESEASEVGVSHLSSQETPEFTKESRKKAGRSGKKKSGVVVIRNINYITSEAKADADTESGSGSGSESETSCNEDHGTHKTSKKKDRHGRSVNGLSMSNKEDTLNGKDSDAGHWQAFQGFLLRGADEENLNNKNEMFAQEQDMKTKRRQSLVNDDPLLMGGQHGDDTRSLSYDGIREINGKTSRRNTGPNDDFLLSGGSNDGGRDYSGSVNMQYTETNGKRVITRFANDDFVVGGRRNQSDRGNLADPLAGNGFDDRTPGLGGEGKKEMGDESFIVPFRSSSDEVGQYGRTIDMDAEHPSSHENNDDSSNGIRRQTSYEPDALSLMPERGMEGFHSEYDPALDYEIQVAIEDKKRKETNVKEISKDAEKARKPKGSSGTLDKRRAGGPMKKEKPSRMNVLEDARARAEKLRSFKADMQKIKKEKEEEDKKRIEALKLERQKRIAARANPASGLKPESKMQTRKLPSKLSPISRAGSKFSDTEPGASSPLQRSKIATISQVSSDSRKPSKAGKLSYNNHMEGNRLTRSVSSISDPRKESLGVAPDAKASMARIRRLSEPKASPKPVIATKVRSAEVVMKRKLSNGPDNKKISAIMNLDKTKAATLPELKIKASKGPSNVNPVDSTTKVLQKSNGAKSSSRSLDAGPSLNDEKRSHDDYVEDNPIIEKTVVMMEYEKPSVSTTTKSTVRAPPSLVDTTDSTPSGVPVESKINQVKFDIPSAANSTKEEPYLAPHARNSSLEEPCIGNSEHGKAPPVSSYMGSTVKETDKSYAPDVKNVRVDTIPQAIDKTQVRESAKGFRRLLKFGKKNHTSATNDRSVDLEISSVKSFDLDDTKTVPGSSSEVYTLKNLISQDVSPSSSFSQKSSRHFSLFAPFRGKSSEKRLTA